MSRITGCRVGDAIRRPAGWGGGLRRQAGQQELHTRLKSTCRLATSATMRGVDESADMAAILPRPSLSA